MHENNQSLLVTKLYRPRQRAMSVVRPRLQQMLKRGQENGWILVAAAAGAGKTTLLVDWTEPQRERTCWLALDRGDSDPNRFFTYLVAAIQTCEPALGQALMAALESARSESIDSIVDGLLNQLSTLSETLIIVLDDYHLIENEQVHQAVTRLLSHLPESVTFALLTRADPPLPLGRMRANGNLTEVRAHHLAFTQDEATHFFNESFGLDLTPDQVDALSERTEGWSAGLQLAALALQSHAHDKLSFIRNFTGSHRHVLDYLVEEVLRGQPEAVRDFMMHTAPLRQFNVALCNVVLCNVVLCNAVMDNPATNSTTADGGRSGAKNAAVMLDYLETHNLFLVPLDDSRQWYRYHHLFADLLRAQLDEQMPYVASQIQQAAAKWHEERGEPVEAIDYALKAGSFEYAANLMEMHLMTSYWHTALQTWRRWYHLWPSGFAASYPSLTFVCGHMLLVHGFLDEAIPLLHQVDVDKLEMANRLMLEFLNVNEQHDTESFANLAAQIEMDSLNPLENMLACGLFTSAGDYRTACTMIDSGYTQGAQTGDDFSKWASALHRCRLYSLAGDLQEAHDFSQSLLDEIETAPPPLLDMLGFAYMAQARAHLAWNEPGEAERFLTLTLQHVAKTGFVMGVLPTATMMLAEVRQAQGDVSNAVAEAERAVDHARRHELPSETDWLGAYQVRLQLQQGNLAAGAAWLKTRRTLPPSRFYPQSIYRLAEAEIYLAQNQPDRAITRLTTLTAELSDLHTAEVWLLLALARQASGDGQHALIALTTAISIAEAQNNIRAFLSQAGLHSATLVNLLIRFEQEQPENLFVQKLLSLLPAAIQDAAEQIAEVAGTQSALLDPLGERELEVLRLIVTGHSNKEIAAELILALNTVKWYIKSIYSKLHVTSRSQAIARAHELKLVG